MDNPKSLGRETKHGSTPEEEYAPAWSQGVRSKWPYAGLAFPGGSAQGSEASGSVQETAQAAPGPTRRSGLRARGRAAAARVVARDPAAREAAQIKVRSKFYGKNVETAKSSKLALAEELATVGGCEPIYSLTEVTLLTFAGALDSACHRSASSYIADLRLRRIELDLAISALVRSFKKVIDAVTRGFGPVKKAPKVKLSAISHTRQAR